MNQATKTMAANSESEYEDACYRYIVHRLLRQTNLRNFDKNFNRDLIIGFIGDRGGGKSIGGSQVVTRDYLVRGEPCFSNIEIRPSFKIDDQLSSEWIGSEYGLADGGVANYSSQPLDIYKFLQFSDEYSGGVIYIDEINIALADARRSMSYQNLGSADVGQQLRKLKTALI